MSKALALIVLSGSAVGLVPTVVFAQDDLMSMDLSSLETEVERRYEAALGLSNDPSIINANDTRYLWASEAKAQCGIALGFLKSSTRDEVSLGKCAMAYDRMMQVPMPRPVQAAPIAPPPARVCSAAAPDLVFFDWDSADPGSDAAQVVDYVATNAAPCNWRNFRVVGHADRSGSDSYNQGLSARRAEAVASLMAARGIARSAITTEAMGETDTRVPTADGVRELQNRRVEITVNQ